MGWSDLLQKPSDAIVVPWIGENEIRSGTRTWTIRGKLPPEHGWHRFRLDARSARWSAAAEPVLDMFRYAVRGYLIGDHIVPAGVRVDPDPKKLAEQTETVYLIEPGIERFARVQAGRIYENGPLIFEALDFPSGPEEEVQAAYYDRSPSIDHVKGISPALDVVFRLENFQRAEAERRRIELERLRLEEERRQAEEERRAEIVKRLGDAAGRRSMAAIDFAEAARSALIVSGAEYLDHRRSHNRGEMVVTFRFLHRRFQCTCDERTLQIIDAGICLTAHYDDPEFEGGTKGDTWITLESLPSVIKEAQEERKLVVWRHVDDD